MSSNAFQHSGSEIMLRPINGSSYSSLAKYLPLCVSHTAIIMATTVLLFYSRVNSFLEADKPFPDSVVLLLDPKYF